MSLISITQMVAALLMCALFLSAILAVSSAFDDVWLFVDCGALYSVLRISTREFDGVEPVSFGDVNVPLADASIAAPIMAKVLTKGIGIRK